MAADRDAILDTIGNLTLLTRRLNSKVSNGPWSGQGGKYVALQSHDVFMLNRQLLEQAKDGGTTSTSGSHRAADRRDHRGMAHAVRAPVPDRADRRASNTQGRACGPDGRRATRGRCNALRATTPRCRANRHRSVRRALDVDGVRYSSPSGASRAVSGTSENGWWFRLVDPKSKRSLTNLWRQYVDQRDVDAKTTIGQMTRTEPTLTA